MELDNKILEQINLRMVTKPLLILGEIHGASINPAVVKLLVKKLRISVVLLELESKWNKYLAMDHGGVSKLREKLRSESWIVNAGLLGGGHLSLFKELKESGVKITAVKVENKNWNTAEKLTANKIMKVISKKDANEKFLLVVGNLHARSQRFVVKINNHKKSLIPLGAILRKYSILIKIRYGKGRIKNFKVRNVNNKRTLQFLGDKKMCLKKSSSKYFDYDLIAKRTSPVSNI